MADPPIPSFLLLAEQTMKFQQEIMSAALQLNDQYWFLCDMHRQDSLRLREKLHKAQLRRSKYITIARAWRLMKGKGKHKVKKDDVDMKVKEECKTAFILQQHKKDDEGMKVKEEYPHAVLLQPVIKKKKEKRFIFRPGDLDCSSCSEDEFVPP